MHHRITLTLALAIAFAMAPAPAAASVPADLTPTKAPQLTTREARHELRTFMLSQYIEGGITPSIRCERSGSVMRQACDVTLNLPGTVCRARAAVVERTSTYYAEVHQFRCTRR